MKKLIMTAALAIAAFGAQAQVQDQMIYSIGVPEVLTITTVPSTAEYNVILTEDQVATGSSLPTTTFVIKSNVMWKAATNWDVQGVSSASGFNDGMLATSIANFRNALEFSSNNGTTWVPLGPANSATVDPIPGYENMMPTPTDGTQIVVQARILPMAYDVIPGTYTATSTITVSAL